MLTPPRLPIPAILAPHSDTRGHLTVTTPAESPDLDLPGYLRHLNGHIITLTESERKLRNALVLRRRNTLDERRMVEKMRQRVVELQAVSGRRGSVLDGYDGWVTDAAERLGAWMEARGGLRDYRELERRDGGCMDMLLRELRQMKGELRAEMERDKGLQERW